MQAQCRPGQIQCIRRYIFYSETKRFFEQLQQTRPSNPELISAVKIKTRDEIKVKKWTPPNSFGKTKLFQRNII
jgi:hypothetical protein